MEEPVQINPEPALDEIYTRLVRLVFRIEGVTYGNYAAQKKSRLAYNPANNTPLEYIARYSGTFIEDSETAFDRLHNNLEPYHLLPLFRSEENRPVIYLISDRAIPRAGRSNPWINLGLFILTVLSVITVGGLNALDTLDAGLFETIHKIFTAGWPYAVALLSILGVHEFGHNFAGKRHGLDVTLPYFIPFPLPPLGTMGAFINMRGIPKNRNALFDVGVSGPLAGLVTTLVVLWIGLKTSVISALPAYNPDALTGIQLEGNSILYLFMKFLAFGKLLPEPASYHSLNPFIYWITYLFTGQPIPAGGSDVTLNGIAFAGWCGLLVTSLNLIPAGQLDGGHVSYIILGRKWVRRIFPFVLAATVLLGFFWNGWWLWAVLIYFFGRTYAEPLDQVSPLSPKRRWLGILVFVVFLITFIPVPFNYY